MSGSRTRLLMAVSVAGIVLGYALPHPQAPPGDIADLLGRIPVEDSATGTVLITGSVRMIDGTPVQGARIRAFAIVGPAGSAAPSSTKTRDLAARLVDFVRTERHRMARTREAVTDAEGRFAVTGLPEAPKYEVAAFRKGSEVLPSRMPLRPDRPARFIARPIVKVPFTIRLPDGSMPDEATIVARRRDPSPEGEYVRRWSPSAPAIRLAAGAHAIQAFAGDDREYSTREEECVIRPGSPPPPLELSFQSALAIRGDVRLEGGGRPGEIMVECDSVEAKDAHAVESGSEEPTYSDGTICSSIYGDEFSFDHLEPGTYRLTASRWSRHRESLVEETVILTDRTVYRVLIIPRRPDDDYLVIRAVDASGRPAPDVAVGVQARQMDPPLRLHPEVRPDGSLWVPIDELLRWGRKDEVKRIAVSSPWRGDKEFLWGRTDPREITVHFEEPALLDLAFSGYAESQYRDRLFIEIDQGMGIFLYGNGRLGGDRIQAAPLASGAATVRVGVRGRWHDALFCEIPHTIRLGPGLNEITLPMPVFHTIEVELPGIPWGTRCRLRPLEFFQLPSPTRLFRQPLGSTEQSRPGGTVVFTDLFPGTYRLAVLHPTRGGEMILSVTQDGPVRFEPRPLDAIEVRDATSALEGLQAGDLIAGADGRRFESYADILYLSWLARSRDEIDLMLEREGAQTSARVDLKELAEAIAEEKLLPFHR